MTFSLDQYGGQKKMSEELDAAMNEMIQKNSFRKTEIQSSTGTNARKVNVGCLESFRNRITVKTLRYRYFKVF